MILTAKDAKAQQVNNPNKNNPFNEIMTAIEKQINDSQSETMAIYYEHKLTIFTKAKLEELGYEIEDLTNQKDGYVYRISWEHA